MKNLSRRGFIKGIAATACIFGVGATVLLTKRNKQNGFKCLRCGKCCQPPIANKKTWTGGKLTWKQKQQLLKERKKYPPNENNEDCEMLYFEKGLSTCLVWVMFGSKAREQNCIDYPEFECANGQKRNG